MFGIGAGELVLILIVGLIVFGPGHLPEVGRAIGKGLKEFRKAQAALSSTLDEVSLEPQKKSSPPPAEEKKVSAEEKISLEKVPEEKVSADSSPQNSSMTVDDVINLAKENPIPKENMHEKIFNGTSDNPPPADGGTSNIDSRGNADGSGEQSRSAKN